MATQTAASTYNSDGADAAGNAMQKLREQTDAVVQRMRPQIDAVSTYARDEPTKALLISAATGAALMGLIALMTRSPSRSEQVRGSAQSMMSTMRDAALDLADRAHSVVDDAMSTTRSYADKGRKFAEQTQKEADKARKKAMKAADQAQSDGSDSADSLSDSVSDAWKSLRDQAGPVVDRFRPQLDAVTSYAKDEPARTALGLAAAGAVLIGLFALARGSDD